MARRIIYKLLDLIDVNADTIADGETVVWDDAAQEFIPGAGGGGGAPDTVDYLVGTGDAGLSAEIVVGTTPGGELGGTWASPTVDATHSGSSHASVQAAAEATAAGALSTHSADTTGVHGIADTSALALTANHPSNATFNDHSARHEDGGADEISLTGLAGTSVALAAHIAVDLVDGDAAGGDLSGTYPDPLFGAGIDRVDGINQVLTLTITGSPTGGAFTISFAGFTTAAIPFNATAAQVETALLAVPSIGSMGVDCTGGPLPGTPVVIERTGPWAAQTPASLLTTTDSFTGGTAPASSVAITTAAFPFAPNPLATQVGASGIYVPAGAAIKFGNLAGTAWSPVLSRDSNVVTLRGGSSVPILIGDSSGRVGLGLGVAPSLYSAIQGAIVLRNAQADMGAGSGITEVTIVAGVRQITAAEDLLRFLDAAGASIGLRVNENGYIIVGKIAVPADAELGNSEGNWSVSSGLPTWKGKDSGGVVQSFNAGDHSARHENGGGDELSIAGLDGTSTELASHLADATDAHDASAISFAPTGTIAATDVQTAIAEVATEAGSGGVTNVQYETRSSNTILGLADKGKTIDITATITQTFEADETLGDGWWVILRNATDEGTVVVTLNPDGAETIDGLTTVTMYSGESRLIVCNGAGGNFNSDLLTGGFVRFTADGNFIVPHGITAAIVQLFGGGGGGGGGRGDVAGSVRQGGGGGGGGSASRTWLAAAALGNPGDTIVVDVATGGAAGSGGSTNNGTDGATGANTTFGTLVTGYGGGGGGLGAGVTARSGGSGGGNGEAGNIGGATATRGGAAHAVSLNATGGAGAGCATDSDGACAEDGGGAGGGIRPSGTTSARLGGSSTNGPSGGGAGGVLDTANSARAGGAGGRVGAFGVGGGATGGAATGAAGSAGAAGTLRLGGQGGGGGGASSSTTGGVGGAGGAPGGGGAGGGGGTSVGGAGGAGAAGECRVWYS